MATTGNGPHALLLDNKACNHTDSVDEALGDTTKHRAAPFRPQSKGHVEGAFGLFTQTVPTLCIPTLEPYQLALTVVTLVATTWARSLNHKPRRQRNGQSRVELYWDHQPSKEQSSAAQKRLTEIIRREEKARQTRLARLDPEICALLNEAFERFGLSDPKRHIRSTIAGYAPTAVVSGIAVFDGKRKTGTLPDGADGRYLLRIIRSVSNNSESIAIAKSLYDWRRDQRDRVFGRLDEQCAELDRASCDIQPFISKSVRHAMKTDSSLERHFWLKATACRIHCAHPSRHRALFLQAERYISSAHYCSKHTRQAALLQLAEMLIPVN